MPDLIDLMEEPDDGVVKRIPKFPTMSCEPQKAQAVWRALMRKDWRALNNMGVVWYDEYAGKWFHFRSTFFDVEEWRNVWYPGCGWGSAE